MKSEGDIEVRVRRTTFSRHGLRVLVGRPPGLAGFRRLKAVVTCSVSTGVRGTGVDKRTRATSVT